MNRSTIAILGLLCLILHPVFAEEAPPPLAISSCGNAATD